MTDAQPIDRSPLPIKVDISCGCAVIYTPPTYRGSTMMRCDKHKANNAEARREVKRILAIADQRVRMLR